MYLYVISIYMSSTLIIGVRSIFLRFSKYYELSANQYVCFKINTYWIKLQILNYTFFFFFNSKYFSILICRVLNICEN